MIKLFVACLTAFALVSCASQAIMEVPASGPIPERNANIGYKTPEEALRALEAKSGVRIRSQQGWTIAEDQESEKVFALWTFTQQGHPAHPSVVKRIVYEEGGKVWVRMGVICGAEKEPCDTLVRDFSALTEQMKQSLQNRKP